MSDIVERLNDAVLNPLCQQAADELTRLRADVERLTRENFALAADQCHAGYAGDNGDHRCREQDRLRAEISRLREQVAAQAAREKVLAEAVKEIHGCFQAARVEGLAYLRSEIEDLPEVARFLDVLDRRIMFAEGVAVRARAAISEDGE